MAADQGPADARRLRVDAVVLAAGCSQRMRGVNKLLADLAGRPLVQHAVESVSRSKAAAVVVVTGHQAELVRQALAPCCARLVHNPHYARGLSSSLKAGVDAVSTDSAGVLVCLGDMPAVTARELNLIIDAFTERGGRVICVPVLDGRRGNPVLWPREFLPEFLELTGDEGARRLLARHAGRVHRVEMPGESVLCDVDDPGDLDDARRRWRRRSASARR